MGRFYFLYMKNISYKKSHICSRTGKEKSMGKIVKTMKLRIDTDEAADRLFRELTERYASACNEISQYMFDHEFPMNFVELKNVMYHQLRDRYGLKSQMTLSSFKTVIARYKTVQTQLADRPFRYKDADGEWQSIDRTLEWLWRPIHFRRPQADLVRGRDYSFVKNGTKLSINTLKKRVKVSFHVSEVFQPYFDGSWSFGTGKLVSLKGRWYFHIPMTKTTPDTFDRTNPEQLVGIDRGLRFLAVTYDEQEKSHFINGKDLMKKRDTFANVRAELQSKGSRSAKRALKRISGRENRWMTDVNHQITKTLVTEYGPETLFVLEDLKGVSFEEENLSKRSKTQRRQTRSWAFYQLEQLFTYKAKEIGADVIKVSPAYTSQRCPKCGRIHKENRHREIHEYICDVCGYRSNDDRVGAMNLFELGLRYVSGDRYPSFKIEEH